MEMAGETEVMESKTIPPSDYTGHILAAAPAQSTLNPLAAEKLFALPQRDAAKHLKSATEAIPSGRRIGLRRRERDL